MIIEYVPGVMLRLTITAGLTVTLAVPDMDASVALIVVVPRALVATIPPELTPAMVGPDECHLTDCVRSFDVPSE